MKHLNFCGMTYINVRPSAARMNDKFNRVSKLAASAETIIRKLDNIIDGRNVMSRHSAVAIKLAMFTGARIGNEDSAWGYDTKPHPNDTTRKQEFVKTYGITTLRKRHVVVRGREVYLDFEGKKSVKHMIRVTDKKLVQQIKLVMTDEYARVYDGFLEVSDEQVRKFVKKHVGRPFLPKDFRTLYANCVFSKMILERLTLPKLTTKKAYKQELRTLVEKVAGALGNTIGVSKSSYIDPKLIDVLHRVRSAA